MKVKNLLLGVAAFCACTNLAVEKEPESDSWTENWTVASMIVQTNYDECFWIKRNGNPVWVLAPRYVKGFDYVEGYEYNINVLAKEIKFPPEDGSSVEYSLIEIISKTKKESDVPFVSFSKPANSLPPEEFYGDSSFQGDIILTDEQMEAMYTTKSGIKRKIKYWPRNIVYYTFADGFTKKSAVMTAIAEWEKKTSLQFVNGTGSGNYIEFFNGNGNYSSLGMVGGKQQLSMYRTSSDYGTAIHEIGHAVGLIHEQCRNDRDNYITIFPENISPGKSHNFNKYAAGEATDIGTFDFGSIMLYSSDAFSETGEPTMLTKDGLYFIGQRKKLSDGDVAGIETIYGPPFHRMKIDETVIEENVTGLTDYKESEIDFSIKIYNDYNCTVPTTLKRSRKITVVRTNRVYDPSTKRIKETSQSSQVTLPAGTSSYFLGTTYNIEHYEASDPITINTTTYYIIPKMTEIQ